MHKIKIAIVGATGYTGSELVRILSNHPNAEITAITSESRAGEKFSDVHPFFQGIEEQKLIKMAQLDDMEIDLAFLALPHGVSMDFVSKYHDSSFKIVDLSGDFRLKSKKDYEEWYNMEHHFEKGMADAVYGMPELFGLEIRNADLVANPGCFPTSAILGLAPLVAQQIIETENLIVDSKTGVTGAGVKAKPVNMFSNVNDNFKAYKLKTHRHTIEIQNILNDIGKNQNEVLFTPHLLPVDRGILSTIYVKPLKKISQQLLDNMYAAFYEKAPFVRMRNQPPAIKDVRATNYCDIYLTYDERTNTILIISAIDNLVKGAAGAAVQNMNLMFGLDETTGLKQVPVNP